MPAVVRRKGGSSPSLMSMLSRHAAMVGFFCVILSFNIISLYVLVRTNNSLGGGVAGPQATAEMGINRLAMMNNNNLAFPGRPRRIEGNGVRIGNTNANEERILPESGDETPQQVEHGKFDISSTDDGKPQRTRGRNRHDVMEGIGFLKKTASQKKKFREEIKALDHVVSMEGLDFANNNHHKKTASEKKKFREERKAERQGKLHKQDVAKDPVDDDFPLDPDKHDDDDDDDDNVDAKNHNAKKKDFDDDFIKRNFGKTKKKKKDDDDDDDNIKKDDDIDDDDDDDDDGGSRIMDMANLAKKKQDQMAKQRKKRELQKQKQKEKEDDPSSVWFSRELNRAGGNAKLQKSDMFPPNFEMTDSVVDILGETFDISTLRSLDDLEIEVPHLGVLLDAGRHYFPVVWIKKMIKVLSMLKFNYLHFRLTDDQAFSVLLKSQPLLAYPTTLDGNIQVYTPDELRDIVQYAKGLGVTVVPEINVPGHSASWGGVPGLILQCPNFICSKGYGVPLNVTHPKLRPVLKDVLKEVIEIFDDPPFLHLGGDEVNMAIDCFREVNEKMFDYNVFEGVLKEILKEIKYDESKVIRWEMSEVNNKLDRAGDITHFWLREPGSKDWNRQYGEKYNNPMFMSTHLYFDTDQEDSAFDVYVKTKKLKHNQHPDSKVLGIIGATFELSTDFWHDRNVVGKLLAVAMGASKLDVTDRFEFFESYEKMCEEINFPDSVKNLFGVPRRRYKDFRDALKDGFDSVWKHWIDNTCSRLTEKKHGRTYLRFQENKKMMQEAKNNFWDTYYDIPKWEVLLPREEQSRLVKYVGVIVDITRYPLDGLLILNSIIMNTMAPLGLNLIQLRMVTDVSFAYFSPKHPKLQYQNPFFKENKMVTEYPQMKGLQILKGVAGENGIAIMPEISVSTNAGGMYKSSFNMECPDFVCEVGKFIPQNIHHDNYLPVVYSLVKELLEVTTSPFIHLGYDEREASSPCFLEATNERVKGDFDKFEIKMRNLLRFAGVNSDSVVRWDNQEGTHYRSRFGDITQCVAGKPCRLATDENTEESKLPWIATVDVRTGGAYEIYKRTRELAVKKPLALMAEIGSVREEDNIYKQEKIDYRLLAFTIGAANLPFMSEEKFREQYVKSCLPITIFAEQAASGKRVTAPSTHRPEGSDNTESHEEICKAFAASVDDPSAVERLEEADEKRSEALKDAMCHERTKDDEKYFMRKPKDIATALSLREGQTATA